MWKCAIRQMEDILEIVHLAEGIAVLSSWNCDHFGEAFISSLIARGFDGIEVFSPLVSRETMARLLKIAKAEELVHQRRKRLPRTVASGSLSRRERLSAAGAQAG